MQTPGILVRPAHKIESQTECEINLGLLQKHASCILAKLQKHTNTYSSLQFPTEMNTSSSKTPTYCAQTLKHFYHGTKQKFILLLHDATSAMCTVRRF